MEAKKRVPRGLLMRGESIVAFWGLSLAAILLFVMGGVGTWTYVSQRDAHRSLRQESLNATGALLGQSLARMLAGGDVSGVRTLILDAVREKRLARCRLALGDGGILADADPTAINVKEAPERFSPGPPPEAESFGSGFVATRIPVAIGARGMVFLDLAVDARAPMSAYWQVQGGIGLIGAAGLSALLIVYRRMRERFRGIGAVREALFAASRGEAVREALAVAEGFGPEAAAWNSILGEREQLRRDLVAERARESLAPRRDAGAELAQACDALWQGLVVIDDRGVVRYANGAAAVFLRGTRDAMIGARVSDLMKDEKLVRAIQAVAAGRVKTRTSVEVQRAEEDGGGILRFSARPVRRGDSGAAIIIIEDITQQRIADAARNAFVTRATHELRTPLTNIRLYVEQAVDEGETDAKVRAHAMNVIGQESRRLERIIGDMLSVAEIEAGSMTLHQGDVRLDALFEELRADFQAQSAAKKQTLTFVFPPKWPVVRGDRDKIVLALHNLVGNAIKYTPDGGTVTVRVEAGADTVVVDVADTGIGISEEESELIFEKFYRSRDARVAQITGSGLGLALAREVVRMHGGDVTVRSQLNTGSTFTMTLPVRAEAA